LDFKTSLLFSVLFVCCVTHTVCYVIFFTYFFDCYRLLCLTYFTVFDLIYIFAIALTEFVTKCNTVNTGQEDC